MIKFSILSEAFRKHFKPVAFQHTVTLINTIFIVVILLLTGFGEYHEALFLSVVVILNIVIGIIQDLRAKISLEQLQILMAPRIVRMNPDQTETIITLEQIQNGDSLKITLGDQIPTDGVVIYNEGLEVNEALITGESRNIVKQLSENVFAGSIVTAGGAIIKTSTLPKDSFAAHMTDRIKQYTYNLSPIQRTLGTFIRYMSYLLLGVTAYVIIHGLTADKLLVSIVKNIAALTSTLVPQGLILATTLFFAYGAIRLFKRQVLLQEINATEKLGLIQNLCVDKTGTLTENQPRLETIIPYDNQNKQYIQELLAGYLSVNGGTSQTAEALGSTLTTPFTGQIIDHVPFSSERKYGEVKLQTIAGELVVVLGAPDILLNHISDPNAKTWVQENIDTYATQAKRLVLLATSEHISTDLNTLQTFPVALFVLDNPLRPGTKEIIEFFQTRGVRVRVISGDHPKTVQAIAEAAGIKNTDIVITGPEMADWDDEKFEERAPAYRVFARIYPDQKEKIVNLLKRNGFTAMVGDGANDALAIKNADLGIAMFDGAPATRQIAQVVLMNNSFAALPEGVTIAETIVTNIELVASVFFHKVTSGFVLFAVLAALGFTYPISPRNDTIIGYATIWLAMICWSLFPARKTGVSSDKSFIKSILPFALTNGVITALAAVAAFMLSPHAWQLGGSNVMVVLVMMALGFWFLYLSPIAYGVETNPKHRQILTALGITLTLIVIFIFFNPGLASFFDLRRLGLKPLGYTLAVITSFGWLQYQITKRLFPRKQ